MDVEEQPEPFATQVDEKAVIAALMERLRYDGAQITAVQMYDARRREVRLQKQKDGSVVVTVD